MLVIMYIRITAWQQKLKVLSVDEILASGDKQLI